MSARGSGGQLRSWAGPQRASEVKAFDTANWGPTDRKTQPKHKKRTKSAPEKKRVKAMLNNGADGEGPSVFGF